MGNKISRRNFIKILGAGAGATALALSPTKAFAWMGYEFSDELALRAIGFNNPIHEDFLQIAYSILLQRHKDKMDSGDGPNSLINPAHKLYNDKSYTPNQYFLENLKMLRYGAYWNDAAVFSLAEFLAAQLSKDKVNDWANQKNPYYESLSDICEHIEQNTESGNNTFTQFSANGRLDCIHGMLNCYASGAENSGRFTQQKNKDLILEWIEHAYKFAIEGADYSSSKIKFLFDTHNQHNPSFDSQHKIDDSGSLNDTDETKYNTRQLRLRILGMICHTIQDLWNPAHTIRSYYKDSENPERFGTILAFGDYSKQSQGILSSNHKPYDLCSEVEVKWGEDELREILINTTTPYQSRPQRTPQEDSKDLFLQKILNWNGSDYSKNMNIADACKEFNTLGLKYSIKYLSDFLEIAYLGLPWSGEEFYYNGDFDNNENPVCTTSKSGYMHYSSVSAWFEDFVLKSMFDSDGASYIYDGGIKTTMTDYEIKPHVASLEEAFVSMYEDRGQQIADLLNELVEQHKHYANTAIEFYTKYNTGGNDNLEDVSDCKAKTAQDNLFALLKNIFLNDSNSFKKLILPNIGEFLYSLNIMQYASWANLVDVVAGFLQEFYLEVDASHQINNDVVNIKKQLLGEVSEITVIGDVENVWVAGDDVHLALRCKDGAVLYFFTEKSIIDNPNNLVLGAKNVEVKYDLNISLYDSGVFIFKATSIKAPTFAKNFDATFYVIAKIINQNSANFTAEVLDFSENGKSSYLFIKSNSSINLKNNTYYLIEYTINKNMLVCKKADEYSNIVNADKHSSTVTSTFSNCLKYQVNTSVSNIQEINSSASKKLEESDLLFYNKAQVCGNLVQNEKIKFIYSAAKLENSDKSDNVGYGYKQAIKIVSDSYNNDGSMNLYLQHNNSSHIKTDKKLNSSSIEPCSFKNGVCEYCGAKEISLDESSTPDTSDNLGPAVATAIGATVVGSSGVLSSMNKN